MTDSQEKSDDLIAELAKLMASDSQGAATVSKPGVIKLPSLGEPSVPPPGPIRIPGMEPARPATPAAAPPRPAMAAAPAVRIPGMERPAGISDPLPAAPAPRPASQFDFGKAPPAPPVLRQEPLTNWQTAEVPRSVATPVAARPEQQPAPPRVAPQAVPPVEARATAAPTPLRVEPKAPFVPAPQPLATAPAPEKSAPPGDSFGFDFGFGTGPGNSDDRPAADADESDPIADLIAAELDAAEADDGDEADAAVEPAPAPPPAPVVAPVLAAAPAAAPAGARLMSPLPQRPISIKPVSIPSRPAEERAPPPVFSAVEKPMPVPAPVVASVASRPEPPVQAPSPRVELDPMDEIENLIGEAVRVELGNAEQPRPAPVTPSRATPVVPPLNTGFAPRRSALRDTEPQVQSAEAAILAAAAASGAEVGRLEGPVAEDRSYKRMKVKPPRTQGLSSNARQYVGIAVAGTLLLAAGFGLYWVLGMNRADPENAPVLTADESPAKVEPVVVATADTAQPSGSAVFNEIEGVRPSLENEELVSRDETEGSTVTEVASAAARPVAEDSTETGLANRKVRTVTVRPDGTIVSGDEAVAGTSALPVERPNVPEIPGGQLAPSELLTAVAETESAARPLASGAAQPAGGNQLSALVDPAQPLQVASADPAQATGAVFDGSLVSPIPMPRPSNRSAMVGGASAPVRQAAPSANAPAATPLVAVSAQQPAATQVSSRGGAYVQLSSQRSESEAAQSLRTTQSRLSGALNGVPLEIRRVDLGAKGVWYRVVLPTNSFQDATQTCASIKSSGGDCVAING